MIEIIIDRNLFNNNGISGFATYLLVYLKNKDGSYRLEFWVCKNILFKEKEIQWWSPHSIYYQYIKSLLPLCHYDDQAVVRYLKIIDLNRELIIMEEENVTRKKVSKINII